MLAAGSPAPFNSTDWMGLRSMARASASRRRGSCAFEFAEKTIAINSTGNDIDNDDGDDDDDDTPYRCDPPVVCGAAWITSVFSSSSAMAWSRSDLPTSISTASTKGRPAQLSSYAAS